MGNRRCHKYETHYSSGNYKRMKILREQNAVQLEVERLRWESMSDNFYPNKNKYKLLIGLCILPALIFPQNIFPILRPQK